MYEAKLKIPHYYTCQLFRSKSVRFSLGFAHIGNCPKKLQSHYKDNPNVSEDTPNIFGSHSLGYPFPSATSSLSKIGQYTAEELSFTCTFQSIIALSTNLHVYIRILQTSVSYGSCNNSYFSVKGLRTWSVGMSEQEIEVFDPQE